MKRWIKLFLLLSYCNITYGFEAEPQFNIIDNLKDVLKYTSQRHKIISDNITQANIPKAQAKEMVSYKKTNKKFSKLKMYTTSSKHFQHNINVNSYKVIKDREANIMTPNGNNIDLVQQSAKMEENSFAMKKANKLYKQHTRLRKLALGEQRE